MRRNATVSAAVILWLAVALLTCYDVASSISPILQRIPRQVALPEPKELLVSYLAAVSQFPKDLYDGIQELIEKDSVEAHDNNDTHIFNRLSQCFRTDFEGSMISGALQVAIEEINANPNLLPQYKLVYLFNNTCGDEKRSTEFFMEHWKKGAKVFIGPEMNCRTEATMAASQNLPIISHKCKDHTVSDKRKYPTFARTVPAETEITKALIALLKHFNWHKFTIIYERNSRNEELHHAIKVAIEKENSRMTDDVEPRFSIRNVSVVAYPFSEVEKTNVEQIILDTHVNTRIFLTFGNVRLFRRILMVMGGLGLMDNGEYVLIFLDTDYNWHNVYHAMNNHFFRDTMIELRRSWEMEHRQVVNYSKTALAIIPTPVKLDSPKFTDFWHRANEYLVNFGVQKHELLSVKANRFACYLYDAVMIYAQALHETILEYPADENYDPIEDGTTIISKVIGRKYTSMQGFDMRINENGDAQGNYTLLSLQAVEPILDTEHSDYYPLGMALTISADFVEDVEGGYLPKMRFEKSINWPHGSAPLDEPECGFANEKCLEEDDRRFQLFMGFFVLGTVVCFLAGSVIVYRNRKFERELSMIWRIDPKEISKIVQRNNSATSLYVPDGSQTSLLHVDDFSAEKRWSGLRGVALHKGTNVVAIKEMRYMKKPRELTRATKIEMMAMRQLHHDNVNSFIGIIICPMSICVVREYCPKCSLMEILRNRDLKMDMMFISSFLQDLIAGMIYLHGSDVKVHGNLKSTNCLITARWALQVADFGLHEIREGQEWDSPDLMWESYLWTAPELLRECEFVHAVKGTQKGDVYSFGIILHEMMVKKGPFELIENQEYTAEQIVRKIAEGRTGLRPISDNCSPIFDLKMKDEFQQIVVDTMIMCWSEVPEHRPDFRHQIRHKLKPIMKDVMKHNIMDMIMERYRNQLESLVEERTAELREEKRRTEHLLQRMLPISVAKQLLLGKDVVPESFSSVTIYFSDIVGFTTISGQSTPLEVVNFLNNLYTLFDSIIKQYDVYKVETIGDAYMVVSGVPMNRDESYHAVQIGTMALHLLSAVENFKIPHRPHEPLKLRIGIHTGPVVAGIVGKTMPRYCLFGDTVNTASRMETYGEPLKIHCSESFSRALPHDSRFVLDARGELEIKGKGKMRTYWLLEQKGADFGSVDGSDLSDEELAPEIFPRPSVRQRLDSSWAINKGSLISLSKEGLASTLLLKKLVDRAASRTPLPAKADHVEMVPIIKCPNGTLPDTDCESQLSVATQPNFGYPAHSSTTSSMNQCGGSFDYEPRLDPNVYSIRKRSTSLPDGEVLKINHFSPHLAATAPPSSTQSPAVAPRKNAIAVNYVGTFDQLKHMKMGANDADVVPAPRKRSLSYGDTTMEMVNEAIAASQQAGSVDSPLITPPAVRKKKFRKDRKSALSLQYTFESEMILAKKPLGHPSLRERSPVTSFNRLWRRLTMTEGDGVPNGAAAPGAAPPSGSAYIPLLSSKLIVPDDCLMEETDNSTLNDSTEDALP